jgi:acyl-CoA synthetase (AMP-forming)/AMP-acid ligase II
VALQLKAGRGCPLVDMRVVAEDGAEQPWDGKSFGNLQVRGPWVVRRYYKVRNARTVSCAWDITFGSLYDKPLMHTWIPCMCIAAARVRLQPSPLHLLEHVACSSDAHMFWI